ANRMAASGILGGVMGATAAIGVPALVASFATCGTGTAIASLHGAVATNATMAWLGGGTIASGGFGIVGGTVVLGGIVTIATIATASLVTLGFALYDEKEQRRYSMLLANKLEESRAWEIIADRCGHSMLSA
ncbi:MAG: hypothetical protein PHS31_02140, partial [Victivallaceae bacterium]|nr:hypothetical protein [Victivallaceae bacterium]